MRKKLALFAVTLMSATLLSACGGSDNTDNDTEAVTAEASSEDAIASDSADISTEQSELIDVSNLETISLSEINPDDYVTLGEYKGVTVELAQPDVTDEEVEEYINNIAQTNPPTVEVTGRAVQDGDTVDIDYVGKYADTQEAFDGGTAEGATLVIGSDSYIDGFEDGLIGVNAGETVDLNLTFPDDYGAEDLQGKEVVFTVTVNKILEESDELTDEWAAGLGATDVTNLDELRVFVKDMLLEEEQADYDSELENTVVELVTDGCTFEEVPEKLYNRFLIQEYEQIQYYASMYSYYYGSEMSAEDFIQMSMDSEGYIGTAEEFLEDVVTDMTEQYIMFAAIAKKEGIEITDDDIDEYLHSVYDENAATSAYSSFDEYKASLDMETYREGLMARDVVEFLKENANVVPSN